MDVDGKGFIWIATEEGLNRWTGNGNTIYRENNSGLASNELTTVYYDAKSNSVWAGSRQKGISIFDCHTSQFSHLSTKEGLASDAITDIMPAGDEGLWITHVDNGISYYNRNTHKIYVYNSSTLSIMQAHHLSLPIYFFYGLCKCFVHCFLANFGDFGHHDRIFSPFYFSG